MGGGGGGSRLRKTGQDTTNKSIWAAAEAGDTATLANLIMDGSNVNCVDPFMGRTPLQYACSRGQEAAAMLLLLHGANADCDIMGMKDTFDSGGAQVVDQYVEESLYYFSVWREICTLRNEKFHRLR